jgi:lipoate-protein ligase B
MVASSNVGLVQRGSSSSRRRFVIVTHVTGYQSAALPSDVVKSELWVCHLPGTTDYLDALDLQGRLRAARQAELVPDVMLLLEHPPVYTRGRRSGAGELPFPEEWYRSQGIEIVGVDRGGKITYHGPGQLVGYPIVRTDDVVAYVRTLERAIVAALSEEGLVSGARVDDGPDYTGVWIDDRKIASIGVHFSRGVTTHGFAVNIDNDLAPFGWVVACGLPDVQMTSLSLELGTSGPRIACFRKRVAFAVAEALERRQRIVTRDRLEAGLLTAAAVS